MLSLSLCTLAQRNKTLSLSFLFELKHVKKKRSLKETTKQKNPDNKNYSCSITGRILFCCMNADWDANWKENFQLETGLIAVCVPHIHAPPSWNVLHGDYIQSYVQLSSSWHGAK
jgi:hypothetical protein